jgi:hypothetical protein
MRAKCIDDIAANQELTYGKVYTIYDGLNDRFTQCKNNQGRIVEYYSNRFKPIKSRRKSVKKIYLVKCHLTSSVGDDVDYAIIACNTESAAERIIRRLNKHYNYDTLTILNKHIIDIGGVPAHKVLSNDSNVLFYVEGIKLK